MTIRLAAFFLCLFLAVPLAAAESGSFPLKDGDTWVMAGDSITAQHLHSNYFEAFCFARYPKLKFAFRNSGVGGHTIPSTLARFEYDIAGWKPTVVSVELGMNDRGGTPTDKFVANMKMMVERIRGVGARPVILSASPENNGDFVAKLSGGNQRLHEYALALRPYAEEEKIPYADQFHLLTDVWAKNMPRERLSRAKGTLVQLAKDESLAGVEHLRAFLAAQEKSGAEPVSMHGDPVHPGATGQLMMAAALLKELGADPFVSSASLDAIGKTIDAKGCTIENISAANGVLSFERLDERLPFPIPDDARPVLSVDPTILALSQYTLQVKGLKEGTYTLKINGQAVSQVNAKQLSSGINLTDLPPTDSQGKGNAIIEQSRAILSAVAAKEGQVGQWRGLSKELVAPATPKTAAQKEELTKQLALTLAKVLEADDAIRAAAKPKTLKFEITPVQ